MPCKTTPFFAHAASPSSLALPPRSLLFPPPPTPSEARGRRTARLPRDRRCCGTWAKESTRLPTASPSTRPRRSVSRRWRPSQRRQRRSGRKAGGHAERNARGDGQPRPRGHRGGAPPPGPGTRQPARGAGPRARRHQAGRRSRARRGPAQTAGRDAVARLAPVGRAGRSTERRLDTFAGPSSSTNQARRARDDRPARTRYAWTSVALPSPRMSLSA